MEKMRKSSLPIDMLELELDELYVVKGGTAPDPDGLLSGIGCGCGCGSGIGCGCGSGNGCGCGCGCEPLN